MSRSKWTFRNYNAFLREAKREHSLTHRQAQYMYRSMRERLNRSLFAIDLKRHPRIAKQEAKKAPTITRQVEATLKAEAEIGVEEVGVEYITVESAEEWLDNYKDWSDEYGIEEEEWESTADYEETT